MPLPHAREARLFYQSAFQRFEDAVFLLSEERTTGAVYLAGYSVECMLKALILSSLSPGRRNKMLDSFRGRKGHEYGWLMKQYHDGGGPPLPATVASHLALVATWSTDLRYQPGSVPPREARAFVGAVRGILIWADQRL